MNTNHTPAPWIICECEDNDAILSIEQDGSKLIDEDPSIIAEVDLQGDGITPEIGRANARLIAAAPNLLTACQRILQSIEWRDTYDRMTPEEQAATLRAAIAEATQP